MHLLDKALGSTRNYKQQIINIFSDSQSHYGFKHDSSLNIQDYMLHLNQYSRFLRKSVTKCQFSFDFVKPSSIYIANKVRIVYPSNDRDKIVQSVIYHSLSTKLAAYAGPHVYGFIKGKSTYQAIYDFSIYVRNNISNNKCDLYVWKIDIESFTDRIPIHDHALLWKILGDYLLFLDSTQTISDYTWDLLKQCIRPMIRAKRGDSLYQNYIGLPMGSPLVALISVIYLTELDQYLNSIPEMFYARFGDDMIVAHTDAKKLLYVQSKAKDIIKNTLKLTINIAKEQNIYLTKCGRPPANYKQFNHSHKIDLLGHCINGHGNIEMKLEKRRLFLNDFLKIIENVKKIMSKESVDSQGKTTCDILSRYMNNTLKLKNSRLHHLLSICNDRVYLKKLDYDIAFMVSQKLSNTPGIKSWRYISYRKIRREWHLISLCQLKNRIKSII